MDTSSRAHDVQERLRRLPSVDTLLNQPPIARLLDDYPRNELLHVIRAVLDERRAELQAGEDVDVELPALALEIRQQLYERTRPSLRPVINATGIVLHTGLGRAPLAEEAVEAINDIAGGYCNLEFDLNTGERGSRHDHVRDLLCELTGAEDALVVNNNAAATYLALNTLGEGREVIVSRGQLVEIGGSYRMPDIMAAARCRMVEVGTTNRTRIGDYERAINDQTALLIRVHCSNYRIVGFTESTPLSELVELARWHNLLVIDDLGSGLISTELGWPEPIETANEDAADADTDADTDAAPGPEDWDEPNIADSINDGADVTLFSGDKLLGGPQAGIIIGRADLVAAMRANPLARTFRPDKLSLAALEATLRLYRDPATAYTRVPTLRLLARQPSELEASAHKLAEQIADAIADAEVYGEADESEAGGGSLAAIPFPTWVVRVELTNIDAADVAAALRTRDVPIICRVNDEALVFDVRTLLGDELNQIAPALADVVRELNGE